METWYRVSNSATQESEIQEVRDVVKSNDRFVWIAPFRESRRPLRSLIGSSYECWFKTKEEAINRINSLVF